VITLRFRAGTIELTGATEPEAALLPGCIADPRTGQLRAPGNEYAAIVTALVRAGCPYDDLAKRYTTLASGAVVHREPRPFQAEAVACWERARSRGVVVLPTGAGKSHVAVMAIEKKRRSTLVVAPTLDLVRQWYDLLRTSFGVEVGVIGGGEHEVRDLTVTTYDSAHIHVENFGDRFGLVIFDECHHLPGASYALSARLSIAPFRLGLTATPERADGREDDLAMLIGPLVYRRDIVEMSGEYLADYETVRLDVELTPDERLEYDDSRGLYRDFIRSQGIDMKSPSGWGEFIKRAARSQGGRDAMRAYRRQRELSFAASAKIHYVAHLLHEHRNDRAILFTQDNATAYLIAKRFLVPVITHQTKVKERSAILAGLADGTYSAVVTSKVLNEGVDIPDANVAVVVSGSGSVREHVQRLGRILRKKDGKSAILYELVTSDTAEGYTSNRRREHSAYR
jgi:superfamily II DNA or RNA helicase